MSSDVSDVCEKLQGVQLQLHLVLSRNEEVIKHLEEVEKILIKDGTAIDKEHFTKNIQQSRTVSKKLEESITTQCKSLGQAVSELEKRTSDMDESLPDDKSSLEFQLKSQLNHNVSLHHEKAELETRLKEHMETLKESGKQTDKLEEELIDSKKQVKDLLDLFEGKAQEAEKRIAELHEAMEATQNQAKKFQEMYEMERETNKKLEREKRDSNRMENGEEEDQVTPPLLPVMTDGRPQTSVKRAKSAAINPQHIDPIYQALVEENKKLKFEVDRLRVDNGHLTKKTKQAQMDIETIQNHVATCSMQRDELRRRLKKQQDEQRVMSASMTRQASDWIMQKKMVKDIDHHNKVGRVQPESTMSATTRYRSHPIKASEDKPRNIPVESWSSDNPLRAV